jgi:hypothetical protein
VAFGVALLHLLFDWALDSYCFDGWRPVEPKPPPPPVEPNPSVCPKPGRPSDFAPPFFAVEMAAAQTYARSDRVNNKQFKANECDHAHHTSIRMSVCCGVRACVLLLTGKLVETVLFRGDLFRWHGVRLICGERGLRVVPVRSCCGGDFCDLCTAELLPAKLLDTCMQGALVALQYTWQSAQDTGVSGRTALTC